MANNRSRNIGLLLYPEWENFDDILGTILTWGFPYAYIFHDKDLKETEENEEEKKLHVHVYIQFDNARSFSSIAKTLGIEERFVQGISNRNSYLRYLVHMDNPEKYQYSLKELYTSQLDDELQKAFSLSAKLSAGYEFKQLFVFIRDSKTCITYEQLASFALDSDIVTYYRQYYGILKDLLIEHNERVYKCLKKSTN